MCDSGGWKRFSPARVRAAGTHTCLFLAEALDTLRGSHNGWMTDTVAIGFEVDLEALIVEIFSVCVETALDLASRISLLIG